MFFGWYLAPDVDECKEKLACQCPECSCKNTWGSYECSCSYGLLYMQEHDICISKYPQSALFWLFDEIHTVGQFHLMFTTHWFDSCEFAYTNRGRKFLVIFILKWSFMLICLHWLALHGCWILTFIWYTCKGFCYFFVSLMVWLSHVHWTLDY